MTTNYIWGGVGKTTTTTDYNLGTNWSNSPSGAPPVFAGQSAEFSATGSSVVVVTAGPITPDSWTFDASSQSDTVAGQAVNFSNAATLTNNANAGQAISISNNMTGTTLSQAAGSTLTLSGANSFTNTSVTAGTLANAGNLTTSLTNSATFTNTGTLNGGLINTGIGGTTRNSGTINGGATVTGGILLSDTATSVINGGLTNSAGASAANQVNGAILNQGSGGFTVVGGALTGNSTFTNNDTALLLVTNDFSGITTLTNNSTAALGVLVAAGSTLTANSITNNAGYFANNGTITTTGGTTNAASATFTNEGIMNGGLSNAGTANNFDTLNGGLFQTAGTTINSHTINDGVTVTGGTLDTSVSVINGGLTNSATVNAGGQVNGAIINQGSGTFTVSLALVGNSTFTNNALANLAVTGGDFVGITTLTNSSTSSNGIVVAAGNTLSASNISNNVGAFIQNSGTLSATMGPIGNSGTLNNLLATSVINGGLSNTAGITTNAGQLSGGVTVSGGTVSNNNTVGGGVTVSGTGIYTQTAGTTSGGLSNGNIVNANGGGFGGTIINNASGTFNVSGVIAADAGGAGSFINNGTLFVGPFAELQLSDGTDTLNGAISGTGTLAFNAGSDATIDTTNVTVGTLAMSGGAAVHLGVDLTYAGTFSLDAQSDNLFLDGHTLTLSGATGFHGTINGTNGVHDGLAVIGSNIDLSGLFFGTWQAGEDAITLTGTANADHLTGSSKDDEIDGGNGADTIFGSIGNDAIDGGTGTNAVDYSSLTTPGLLAIIQGGSGTVQKGGANGTDTLTGIQNIIDSGTGRSNGDVFEVDAGVHITANSANFNYLIELATAVNVAYGTDFTGISEFVSNTGNNTVNFASDTHFAYLFGSTGDDTLTVGTGGGYLIGEGGANVLNGGANATNLFVGGQGGTDTMNGGAGSASNYYFVDGNDQVNGAGAFNAMIELVSDVTVQLGSAQYQQVQEFVANGGANTVTVANTDFDFTYLYGGAGNDTLSTGSAGGYLIGEGGTNVLTGGGGLNVFVADDGAGADTMNGGSGSNVYFIDANSIVHGAGTFNTVIELEQNASLALGSAQIDTDVQQVILNGGTNTVDFHTAATQVFLYGAAGDDTLFGGSHDDFFYGLGGVNAFVFGAGWGKDTIADWASGTNNQIDLTGIAGVGVHTFTDLTQTITAGNDVITSSYTGVNSITLLGVGSALTASSFHFA